jgi:N-carbamoylputrescine amidase
VRRRQLQAWETVQRGHAIANGMFVAVANRVGVEDHLEFWGDSFVADPFGEIIARAGSSEEVLIVDCDLRLIEETRRNWPFLRDRRIDAYGDLLTRFRS